MSQPIQRVDHVVAVVEDFEGARRVWIEAGCPVVYDGVVSTHRACCVSIGAINLELLSAEAFDGWPALASWCAHAGRRPGVQAVALDPGDLDATVTALRRGGLDLSAPREGGLAAAPDGVAHARWRLSQVDGLAGLLPGVASFFCEFVSPGPHLGHTFPDSPIQFVELRLGLADPENTVQGWQRGMGTTYRREGAGYVVPLGDTPIRVVPGDGLTLVLTSRASAPVEARLAEVVPGVQFAARD